MRRTETLAAISVVVCLFLPNLFYACNFHLALVDLVRVFAGSSLFCLMFFAIFGGVNKWSLLLLPVLVWVPIECFYSWRYREPTSAHVISIVMETSWEEVRGYVQLGTEGLLLLLYLVVVLWSLAKCNYQWSHRSRFWMIGGGLVVLAYLCVIERIAENSLPSFKTDKFNEHPVSKIGLDSFSSSYPLSISLRLADYLYQISVLKNARSVLVGQSTGLRRDEKSEVEVYVVVIGESSRADHWSLYGYDRPTTPLLDQRTDIIVLRDLVSVSAATRISVPVLLSQSMPEDVFSAALKSSWIVDFGKNNFKTYWLSNQMEAGVHDTTVGIYASLADVTKYVNFGRYTSRGNLDGELLNALKLSLSEVGDKKLIVMHTLGSHAPYQFRYSEQFDIFKPSVFNYYGGGAFEKEMQRETINSYDNSVLYTDFFLNEVINILKASGKYAAFWYVSDHGETFLSDGCRTAGHGFSSVYNFKVPSFFWGSNSYRAANMSEMEHLAKNASTKNDTSKFANTVMEMGGFRGLDGFFSENLVMSPRLVWPSDTGGAVDFDQKFASKACE